MKKTIIIFAIIFLLAAAGAAFFLLNKESPVAEWKPGFPLAASRLNIAVVHISNPAQENGGYSYAHHAGILEMQKELNLRDDQITNIVNVPPADTEATEYAMRQAIARGANIIFATSWGYMDTCEKLAAEYPNVIFAHASGYKSNAVNFTNYFGRIYQARYLSGIVAGLQTRSAKIGYVAAQGKDNSEVTGGINAFALGVESVNPRAKVYVKVTHNWFDPVGEADAARALVADGCDVIAQHCDTAYPQIEAQKGNVWGIGYNSDMQREAPDAVLTSVVWHWGAYYSFLVKSVLDGTFTTTPYFGGIEDGVVDISPLNENLVNAEITNAVNAARQRIFGGEFKIFSGVMATNDGKQIGLAKKNLSDGEITGGMDWYYRNVVE